MSDKSALLTGGAGFIGSHLADRLIGEGWFVRVLDNFSTGRWENVAHHDDNPSVEIVRGNLKRFEDCLKAVEGLETVFHFAANPEVRISTISPRMHFEENVVATFNLLEAIRQNGAVKRLVFASSSSVYGEPEAIPVSEEAPIKPDSVYGASKAACESLIHAYSKLYGIRSLVLRYANVVGPRLRHGVVYDFVAKLRENSEVLEILGDGTQRRSYIYVDDAVEATLTAYKHMEGDFEVYNIGNEDWLTVNDVADIVTDVLGLDDVKYTYKPVTGGVGWLGDVKRIVLAIDKVKKMRLKLEYDSREAVEKACRSINGR